MYPVTQAEYAAFLEGPPVTRRHASGRARSPADLPVTGVSWLDARAFCRWRSETGEPARLPTRKASGNGWRGGLAGPVSVGR
ncbi:MAG: SUMF1/EgtB/PvdO family nonheme iron enzyme [Acidobacteria bacterium]|nr:SUMF1/EgtB/PvdO family nonheme iron enzyme [Acidobacteriota bacterium]